MPFCLLQPSHPLSPALLYPSLSVSSPLSHYVEVEGRIPFTLSWIDRDLESNFYFSQSMKAEFESSWGHFRSSDMYWHTYRC